MLSKIPAPEYASGEYRRYVTQVTRRLSRPQKAAETRAWQAFPHQGNPNYRSSCTQDIYSLRHRNEMLSTVRTGPLMENRECIDDIHMRILRVVEDLRAIQRELNFAAMQAPGDPELLEALNELP